MSISQAPCECGTFNWCGMFIVLPTKPAPLTFSQYHSLSHKTRILSKQVLPMTVQTTPYRTLYRSSLTGHCFLCLGHTSHLPSHHSRFFQTAACAHLYMSSFLKAQLGIRALSLYSLCTLHKHSTWSLLRCSWNHLPAGACVLNTKS